MNIYIEDLNVSYDRGTERNSLGVEVTVTDAARISVCYRVSFGGCSNPQNTVKRIIEKLEEIKE